jgi:hypothetical protein
MIRIHYDVVKARRELVAQGFQELSPAPNGARRWARPGALKDVRVIRRDVIDADERWTITEEKP